MRRRITVKLVNRGTGHCTCYWHFARRRISGELCADDIWDIVSFVCNFVFRPILFLFGLSVSRISTTMMTILTRNRHLRTLVSAHVHAPPHPSKSHFSAVVTVAARVPPGVDFVFLFQSSLESRFFFSRAPHSGLFCIELHFFTRLATTPSPVQPLSRRRGFSAYHSNTSPSHRVNVFAR